MKVEITSAAEADLEGIADYIARDNSVRAVSFVRELYERCLQSGPIRMLDRVVAA